MEKMDVVAVVPVRVENEVWLREHVAKRCGSSHPHDVAANLATLILHAPDSGRNLFNDDPDENKGYNLIPMPNNGIQKVGDNQYIVTLRAEVTDPSLMLARGWERNAPIWLPSSMAVVLAENVVGRKGERRDPSAAMSETNQRRGAPYAMIGISVESPFQVNLQTTAPHIESDIVAAWRSVMDAFGKIQRHGLDFSAFVGFLTEEHRPEGWIDRDRAIRVGQAFQAHGFVQNAHKDVPKPALEDDPRMMAEYAVGVAMKSLSKGNLPDYDDFNPYLDSAIDGLRQRGMRP